MRRETERKNAALAMDQAAQNMGGQSAGGGVVRTGLPAEVSALLDQAYVAKVVVGDLRVTTLTEGEGMQLFSEMIYFQQLRQSTCGIHQTIRRNQKSSKTISNL